MLKKWENLPSFLQTEEVRPYYEQLNKKRFALLLKRLFDIAASAVLLLLLWPVFAVLAVAIKLDSPGPVFYRQERVTRYGEKFRIFKFRTMVADADKKGAQVTVSGDRRITRVGKLIRKCRLDELSQLIDIFRGKMTFVGTRPEVKKYVEAYTPEMMATLLLPAGVTSLASVVYKDEDRLLAGAENVDEVYIRDILPQKMRFNLQEIREFSLLHELKLLFMTVFAVLGKDYSARYTINE